MPTPVGHSLMGAIVFQGTRQSKSRWKRLLVYLLVANLADFDFIPGILIGKPNYFHHGPSHSLGAALLVGAIFSSIYYWKRKEKFGLNFLVFSGLYFSHIFVDYFAVDTNYPFGEPLFWPLSKQYFISPILIFSDIHRGGTNRTFFSAFFLAHNWWALAKEFIILTPLVVIITFIRKKFDISTIDWQRHDRKGR